MRPRLEPGAWRRNSDSAGPVRKSRVGQGAETPNPTYRHRSSLLTGPAESKFCRHVLGSSTSHNAKLAVGHCRIGIASRNAAITISIMKDVSLFRRRDLPHWDEPGASYFVTSCLADSIPAQGLLEINNFRSELPKRVRPNTVDPKEWERILWKQLFVRVEHWLDLSPGSRWLDRAELAIEVANALLHFAGDRCDVWSFVVMPSHFHWVFCPRPEWVESLRPTSPPRSPRQRLVQSVKLYSAGKCNRILNRIGKPFWQDEAYDHWTRSLEELERIITYVEWNPVKARLVEDPADWKYSSAWLRRELNLKPGEPIPHYKFR